MKIGIFGDSYAYDDPRFKSTSWVKLLSNDFDVTTYAENGASTYLIYKNFLENYEQFDKTIVIVTFPLRIHTSLAPVSSSIMVDVWMKYNRHRLSFDKVRLLTGVRNYIDVALYDSEIFDQYILFHNLMLDKIKDLKKEILFIPAFKTDKTEFNKNCLYDVTCMENEWWGESFEKIKHKNRHHDERQCHFCDQNNYILYTQVKRSLNELSHHSIFDINLSTFVKPDDISNYFPSNVLE